LEGIFHVLKTGIKWKALPKEEFGCPSCIHAYFKKWEEGGLFRKLWEARLVECDEMKGIAWEWIDAGKIADTDSSNPGASQTANAKDIPSKGSWRPIVPRRNRSKHPDQMFFRLVEHASSSPAQSVEAQEKAV